MAVPKFTMQIREANLYISSQLMRWLRWLAEMRSEGNDKVTPDSMAEEILREAILRNMPNIEAAESEYWKGRGKLDAEALQRIKASYE